MKILLTSSDLPCFQCIADGNIRLLRLRKHQKDLYREVKMEVQHRDRIKEAPINRYFLHVNSVDRR